MFEQMKQKKAKKKKKKAITLVQSECVCTDADDNDDDKFTLPLEIFGFVPKVIKKNTHFIEKNKATMTTAAHICFFFALSSE